MHRRVVLAAGSLVVSVFLLLPAGANADWGVRIQGVSLRWSGDFGQCVKVDFARVERSQHGETTEVHNGLQGTCGEAPRALWIDQDSLNAGGSAALVEVAKVAPGGLEDGAAALVVPEHAIEAAVEEVDVERRLADIDAADCDGARFVHSCVLVPLAIRVRADASVEVAWEWMMDAADIPSYYTDRQSEGEAVQPASPHSGGRDLLHADAAFRATCGTAERRSEVLEANPLSATSPTQKEARPRCVSAARSARLALGRS